MAENVFFPGIGSLVAGRYVAEVCQLGLNVTAALTLFIIPPLGFLIGFGNWVWAITSAAGAPSRPVRVVVESGQMAGRL